MTYKELNEKANSLASSMKKNKINKGDNIVLILKRGFEMIASMFAAMKVGACYIPIDVEFPKERIEYILKDCSAKMIITNIENTFNGYEIL